jgi:hypothetical protein
MKQGITPWIYDTAVSNGNAQIAQNSISGTATSGTVTSLTDSAANFPTIAGGFVSSLAGQWAYLTRLANGFTYPVLITSNTATQISFATLPNAIVVGDTYQILPMETPMDTLLPIQHYTFPYTLFPLALTAYSPSILACLTPHAKRRYILAINNLNQQLTSGNTITFDSMGDISGTSPNIGSPTSNPYATWGVSGKLGYTQSNIISDSLLLSATTIATAPTAGQVDIYVREVL